MAQDLSKKYEQYLKDEQKYQQSRVDLKASRDTTILAVFFESHFVLLAWLLIMGVRALAGLAPVQNVDYMGLAASLAIFGGAGVIVWIVYGNAAFWTKSWKDAFYEHRQEVHQAKFECKSLAQQSKDRKEFFRFYELYQTDENFRDRYDKIMTSDAKVDQQEFLQKLVGDMNGKS